ncbi:MAG: hypothetical protein ABI233_05085, partial [Chthoniobacterales bacterium]
MTTLRAGSPNDRFPLAALASPASGGPNFQHPSGTHELAGVALKTARCMTRSTLRETNRIPGRSTRSEEEAC